MVLDHRKRLIDGIVRGSASRAMTYPVVKPKCHIERYPTRKRETLAIALSRASVSEGRIVDLPLGSPRRAPTLRRCFGEISRAYNVESYATLLT